MSRYIFQDAAVDGKGNRVTSATVSVYEAGGSTAASIYTASAGGIAVNSVTTGAIDGTFSFYVDTGDYTNTKKFKLSVSKTDFITFTVDDIKIFPASSSEIELESVTGKYLSDLFDGGYDVAIKPQYIFGGGNNTNGHTVPNIADDTFVCLAASQTLTNKTLTTPTISNFTNMNHTHYTAASGGVIVGRIFQKPFTQVSTVDTGTTLIAFTDAIPQNTHGDEYMTQAITPTNASNKLIIEVLWFGSSSASGQMTVALFQDSTADALAVVSADVRTGSATVAIPLIYEMSAGTTSSTTFKVRAGQNNAGTTTFNGAGGTRLYGGKAMSSIKVTEIQALF